MKDVNQLTCCGAYNLSCVHVDGFVVSKSFTPSLGGYLGDVNSSLWIVKFDHTLVMRWSTSTWPLCFDFTM